MTEFKARDFCGSNALWNYMVVNAPVEVLHNPPKPLRIFTPKYTEKGDNHNIIFTST